MIVSQFWAYARFLANDKDGALCNDTNLAIAFGSLLQDFTERTEVVRLKTALTNDGTTGGVVDLPAGTKRILKLEDTQFRELYEIPSNKVYRMSDPVPGTPVWYIRDLYGSDQIGLWSPNAVPWAGTIWTVNHHVPQGTYAPTLDLQTDLLIADHYQEGIAKGLASRILLPSRDELDLKKREEYAALYELDVVTAIAQAQQQFNSRKPPRNRYV